MNPPDPGQGPEKPRDARKPEVRQGIKNAAAIAREHGGVLAYRRGEGFHWHMSLIMVRPTSEKERCMLEIHDAATSAVVTYSVNRDELVAALDEAPRRPD